MSEIDKRSRSTIAVWVVVFVPLPVVYVLSVGPAALVISKGPFSQPTNRAIEAFYWPLTWIANHSELANILLDRYLDLWIGPH